MLLAMDPDVESPRDRLRTEAVTLVSRIRIALPYRRATTNDIAEIDAVARRMAEAGIDARDEARIELANLRETLEILTS